MKTLSPVPHDGLFKTFLTNTDTARDFLSFYLPPELLEICDITTLQLESGSFIEENLRTYFADVLYSLRTSNGTGYIYTLIEHQSSSDKHMAFRLMRYAIAAMQRHIEAGHTALPLVVPLLFCHGRATPWPYTTDWTALFAEPELARRLYTRSFPLIDVGAMDDADIMKHRRMAMLELTSHLSSQEDVLMTIAEYLEQKGLTKGLQKGRTEGEREVTLKIARALLQNGIAPDTVSKTTGLSEQELTSLSQANPTA